jgi:zinc protease
VLRRIFIPLTLVLVVIAAALYFMFGNSYAPRDMREAVPVEKFTLRNGLTVVVMPNSRIPAVTHLLLVKAGGADDSYGKSGVAHYIEHLMFSGTQANPAGTYERTVAKVGGEQNAFTTEDYTGYYATVPKESLETVMQLDSDRLQHLAFTPDQAARELKVITEERNQRIENNPEALLQEQLDAITFLNHPYHQPLIGWAEDMATFTGPDAQRFFDKFYKPGNMILVVAGDIDARHVRRLAQRYYGKLPAGSAPPRNWPLEPPLRLTRHAEMRDAKVQSPRLVRQYIAPSLKYGDTTQVMPLKVMAQYLGGGQTSLLYQSLVREQKLASSVSVDYDHFRIGPALVTIEATPRDGVPIEQLEKALDASIVQALGQLPPETDVTRAKTQLKASVIFAQDGLEALAQLMGAIYADGLDEQYFYSWSAQVEKVTATEMLGAAQAVLAPERRITGYLLPPEEIPATTEASHAP